MFFYVKKWKVPITIKCFICISCYYKGSKNLRPNGWPPSPPNPIRPSLDTPCSRWCVEMTHIALILCYFHGMLNIRRHDHVVIHRLALFLFKLGLVLFLKKKGEKERRWVRQLGAMNLSYSFFKTKKGNCTSLTSLLTSLLWAVSRVSFRVVKEPDCMTFLLAALYLLWGKWCIKVISFKKVN